MATTNHKSESESRAHVLVIPYPAHGHMIPLLDLAQTLASHGLPITVLTTPANEKYLHPLLHASASQKLRVRPLIFPLAHTEGLPANTENITDLPNTLIPLFTCSLQRHLAPRIHTWFRETAGQEPYGRPVCIISDYFMGWTNKTASELGIPRVVFNPSGAFSTTMMDSVWEHMPHLDITADEDHVAVQGLPLEASFKKFQLSMLARLYVKNDPVSDSMRDSMIMNNKSWGAIINTFHDLESVCLDHMERVTGRPVWAVGPLLPPAAFGKEPLESMGGRGKESFINESECLRFLNGKKEGSVVYVCFGSRGVLNTEQMSALALGLEMSGADFVWAVHKSENDDEEGVMFPDGFMERVGDRGLIIRGWAPQVMILTHGSVGCFISHCGWNSVLESLCGGVPLLTWPLTADQHSNDCLLVDHVKVGIRLCVGLKGVPRSEWVKECIGKIMTKESEQGRRAMELQESARRAVKDGGSSKNKLLDFVDAVSELA